jgi:hypothetical protein
MLAEDCLSLETQVLTNSFIAGNSLSPNIGNPFPWTVIVNEQETYTKETCSSELESFQTDNTNSDSNSSGNSELNRTLLDIDLASL